MSVKLLHVVLGLLAEHLPRPTSVSALLDILAPSVSVVGLLWVYKNMAISPLYNNV